MLKLLSRFWKASDSVIQGANVGTVITRIGFWGLLTKVIVSWAQDPIRIIKAPGSLGIKIAKSLI